MRTLGVQWAQEIKKAQKNSDYPMCYQGVGFRASHKADTRSQGNNVLAMPNFPDTELEKQTVLALEKKFNDHEIFKEFIRDHAIYCILCAHQPCAIGDTKQIIYRPDFVWQGITNAPFLLLFENEEACDVVHQIPLMVGQLPKGSDVYIGNIRHDLETSGATPTKERLVLFLEN